MSQLPVFKPQLHRTTIGFVRKTAPVDLYPVIPATYNTPLLGPI